MTEAPPPYVGTSDSIAVCLGMAPNAWNTESTIRAQDGLSVGDAVQRLS